MISLKSPNRLRRNNLPIQNAINVCDSLVGRKLYLKLVFHFLDSFGFGDSRSEFPYNRNCKLPNPLISGLDSFRKSQDVKGLDVAVPRKID